MAKKKIKYNADFLSRFVKSITANGRGTKTQIVLAINDGRCDGRATTVKQLSLWADTGKPMKVDAMVGLVNHFEGVELSDFFCYEDTNEPVTITPYLKNEIRQKRYDGLSRDGDGKDLDELKAENAALKHELLQTQLEHEKELNALRAKYEEREDRIREGYDHTIRTLAERIPPAQSTVVVKDQKGTLTGLAVNDDNSAEAQREKL